MSILSERRALEKTYTDTCIISVFGKVTENGMTKNKGAVLYEGIPCALSQKSNRPTSQTDTVNSLVYDTKLFIAPELIIPPGSVIQVTRLGRVYRFTSTGEPFVYETHQEVALLREGKA